MLVLLLEVKTKELSWRAQIPVCKAHYRQCKFKILAYEKTNVKQKKVKSCIKSFVRLMTL